MPVLAFREKKAAGSSAREPLHGNTVFCNQKEVDSFVETYPTQPKLPKVGCVVFVCSYTVLYCSENVIMILNINSI